MTLPLYNIRFILLISASFITIFSSIAIYFCLPILLSHVMRTQLSISPNSGSYNGWRLNSVIDRFYIYNITNLDELLNQDSANKHSSRAQIPRLKQLGPFTYRQEREKINIKFDSSNETVLYDQVKRWSYLADLSSVKSLEELNSTWIYHINIPLAGTTLNPEYLEFIDPIVTEFDLKLFLNHSANVLMTEGYFDVLMEQAKASGQIDVDKFGWLYNQNNSITSNIRVFTGPSNATLNKIGSIDQFMYKKQFNIWHSDSSESNETSGVKCNDFRFSSAGEFFPPPEYSIISHNNNHQHKFDLSNNNNLNIKLDISDVKDETFINVESAKNSMNNSDEIDNRTNIVNKNTHKTISLFMPDLCRTFKLFYNGTHDFKGLKVDRYIANEFTFDYTSSFSDKISSEKLEKQSETIVNANKCYCVYNETTKINTCPPNGMMDLFTCKKGSPLTISFPHFLYSIQDKTLTPYLSLFEDVSELDESDYQFYIDLESTLNIPVNAQIVIQFNVHLRNEQSLNFLRDYSFLFDNLNATSSSSSNVKSQDLYLPQMWFKSSAEIDENNLKQLKFIQHIHLVTPVTTIIIFAVASILLTMSAKLAYDLTYGPKSRKSISRDQESCSSLNHNESNYLEEKEKYHTMQLLCSSNNSNSSHGGENIKPTTSKKVDDNGESQPLNM